MDYSRSAVVEIILGDEDLADSTKRAAKASGPTFRTARSVPVGVSYAGQGGGGVERQTMDLAERHG